MFPAYPFGPMVDPFARVPESQVREFIRSVASQLSDRFRVEVKWNVPGVKQPNGELFVGYPGTELRTYRVIALPTWANQWQIAGMIESELRLKYQSWAEAANPAAPNPLLVVKDGVGLFEVEEFSTPKVLP